MSVHLYDFEVLTGEEVIVAERAVPLPSSKAAWPRIVAMARRLSTRLTTSGCRIRVKERGETIILIGAAAALRYPDFDFAVG